MLLNANTVDITPPALKTAEGAARLTAAQKEFEDSAAALANEAIIFFDTWEDDILHAMKQYEIAEDVAAIRALIVKRRRKQNAFLQALGA
jgi:hypothetical protein